ncbi:MAG: glutamine--tRNA ligase [Bacteroidia bacterium]|nr:MAG: glutamine--tRNA ligase [Bacteroidia bacterium]
MEQAQEKQSLNFIEQMVEKDLQTGRCQTILTRFPPEPNGYLHIGHAKSIILNFGIAEKYKGKTNLRFDDTNPEKEDTEYVNSIMEDIRWLGYHWEGEAHYASDYFDQLYAWAVQLIQSGDAYVDDQTGEEISASRGTPTRPGIESPFRERSVEENLKLFEDMKAGKYKNGEKVLRAKIDMSSPNMHMRDPIMYRIKHAPHHRTGDQWCIYPMYDFTHGQSDYLEGITHSLCTLEFENHRPLYDWFLDKLYQAGKMRPIQTEFARLNLSYTVMSKRMLAQLVDQKYVTSWDDPRMPTISGLRRRGYTPESLKIFAEKVGIAKRENIIDMSLLEFSIREDLNKIAPRLMVVLHPIKVTITNYPEGKTEYLPAVNNPEDESMGERQIPFSRNLYIEREDFKEVANRKFFRLKLGGEVRLRYAYFIICQEVIKDDNGNIVELLCTYDPESKGGKSPDGRKVKGTLHWVSAEHATDIEIREYDRLFTDEAPANHKEKEFTEFLNPDSLHVLQSCKAEPAIDQAAIGERFQFERQGYFCKDRDSSSEHPVFNRTVTLRDSWKNKNNAI